MADRWFRDTWQHTMGNVDDLIADARHNVAELDNAPALQAQLVQIEQQRTAAGATLRTLGDQRQALVDQLDQLQRELAVAGRPLRGEIS